LKISIVRFVAFEQYGWGLFFIAKVSAFIYLCRLRQIAINA
jgi:hypothetical protein